MSSSSSSKEGHLGHRVQALTCTHTPGSSTQVLENVDTFQLLQLGGESGSGFAVQLRARSTMLSEQLTCSTHRLV